MSDASRHLGARRFSARPIPPDDEPAGALLGDILDANLDPCAERAALRDWVHRAVRYAKLRRLGGRPRTLRLVRAPVASPHRFSRMQHTRKAKNGAIHVDH